jgi:mRNA interferase RelE/StbE
LKVYLSARARKSLDNTPPEVKTRLESAISELFQTPYPAACKKLKGAPDSYRLRVGDYRILYSILSREEIVVFKIAPRGSAYD